MLWKPSVLLLALAGAQPLPAAETVPWDALPDPVAQEFDDPFLDLTGNELYDLATVVRLRDRLEQPGLAEDARGRITERLVDTEARLADGGIDTEELLEQRWHVADKRRRAARAVNPAFDGAEAALKGFLIPALRGEDGVQYAYLVPELGQCSHTPPPPPNNLVRLRLEDLEMPASLYTPVEVTGTLRAEGSDDTIFVLDGTVRMESAWTLETAMLETISVLGVIAGD